MGTSPGDVPTLRDAAFAALNRGDFRGASDEFARVLAAGGADAAVWFGVALARRHLGAAAAENDALEQALALDPNYLPALIRKGDLYAEQGGLVAAAAYYRAAVRLAASQPALPAQWAREVERADAAARRLASEFERQLLATLAAQGLGEAGTERFQRAMELLLGRRKLYQQQPKHFYFPELPQIEFYERRDFPWAGALEQATGRIRAELRALLAGGGGSFEPYIQKAPHRPNFKANPLLDSLDWSACYLLRDGREVAANAARCPDTLEALGQVPLCRIAGRTPSVLFSLLRPGTRIRPHHGYTNARLICHLPLIVPGDCGLRVGSRTHSWREGELVIFDDSMEHEAWNLSKELRVVLLFDVWRPELTDKERTLVAATLEAVRQLEGSQGDWTD
jgi:aspartate beta-hydroxylase